MFGAAAGAAIMLELSVEQTQHALGIAGTQVRTATRLSRRSVFFCRKIIIIIMYLLCLRQAFGVRQVLGSDTKALHPGLA